MRKVKGLHRISWFDCKNVIFIPFFKDVSSTNKAYAMIAANNNYVSVCMFVCFVALHPKSIAMVMAGRSVHLTTLFPEQLEQAVNQYFVHIVLLVTDNNPS